MATRKMKHPTIPFERHEQIGRLLRTMRNEIQTLFIEVANSSRSKRQKRAEKALSRALHEIGNSRSELEEVMWQDHEALASTRVYYGGEPESDPK